MPYRMTPSVRHRAIEVHYYYYYYYYYYYFILFVFIYFIYCFVNFIYFFSMSSSFDCTFFIVKRSIADYSYCVVSDCMALMKRWLVG